jgi:hypothetical protein
MSKIPKQLTELLSRLDAERAKEVEDRVSLIMAEAELPTVEELKLRRPDLAEFIGCLADVEFEIAPELPLPPAKVW